MSHNNNTPKLDDAFFCDGDAFSADKKIPKWTILPDYLETFITAVERNTNGVRTRLLDALKDVS